VETPSSVEFPQQSRIIEIVDNRNGTGSIFLTLFDHWDLEGDDSDTLALLGRELAFADALRWGYNGEGEFGHMGGIIDRNTKLMFAIPDDVTQKLAAISTENPITSAEAFGVSNYISKMNLTGLKYKVDEKTVRALSDHKSMSELMGYIADNLDADDPSGLKKHLTESLEAAGRDDASTEATQYIY